MLGIATARFAGFVACGTLVLEIAKARFAGFVALGALVLEIAKTWFFAASGALVLGVARFAAGVAAFAASGALVFGIVRARSAARPAGFVASGALVLRIASGGAAVLVAVPGEACCKLPGKSTVLARCRIDRMPGTRGLPRKSLPTSCSSIADNSSSRLCLGGFLGLLILLRDDNHLARHNLPGLVPEVRVLRQLLLDVRVVLDKVHEHELLVRVIPKVARSIQASYLHVFIKL